MWDHEVASRVRDRKMAEIGRVVGFTNADRRAKLLGELGRDVCICNCALSGDGACTVYSVPITDPGYRSGLSEQDRLDEDALDSIRVSPPQIRDLIRDVLSQAAGSSSEESSDSCREAMESVKEELRAARDAVERLSAELDYARSQLGAAEDEAASLKGTMSEMEARISALKAEIASLKAEKEAPVAEAENVEPLESESLAPGFLALIETIKEMKSSVMDRFMDDMFSGKADPDLCDGVVRMLKKDLDALDMLAEASPDDESSMADALRRIGGSPWKGVDPAHRRAYEASLDDGERALEDCYSRLLSS